MYNARMAGYSGMPLVKKLGIKPGARIIFINEPDSFREQLGEPIVTEEKLEGEFDYVHFFVTDKKELRGFFTTVLNHLKKNGMLWISWPKKSSGVVTDLNENIIREIGLKSGLVDVKIVAIDDTWSALKFVYRIKDRL